MDVIVAQGTEAGGHTGHRAMLPLLQEALELTDRPVVAAGGIATGRGMAAALVAGAAAVWIGTPLLSCPEALNSPAARARVRAAGGDDTVLTRAFDVAQRLAWPSAGPGGRWSTSSAARGTAGRRNCCRTTWRRSGSSTREEPTTWSRRRSTPASRSGW